MPAGMIDREFARLCSLEPGKMGPRDLARWRAEYARRNAREARRIKAAWDAMSDEDRFDVEKRAAAVLARRWRRAKG